MALQNNYMIIRADCSGLQRKSGQSHVSNNRGLTEREFTTIYNYTKNSGTPSSTKKAIWGDYTQIRVACSYCGLVQCVDFRVCNRGRCYTCNLAGCTNPSHDTNNGSGEM